MFLNRPEFAVVLFIGTCWLTLQTSCHTMLEPKAGSITVTEKHDNTEVRLDKGDTLVVRLESNTTTGYGWHIAKQDNAQLVSLGEADYEAAGGKAVGAGGYQVFRFKAQNVGVNTLELEYKRHWEKDVPPAKTYRVTVNIAEKSSSPSTPGTPY